MIGFISFLIVGVMAGYALRHTAIQKELGRTMPVTVWLLLFVFGVSIGSDPFVMGNLGNFGGQALLLCLAGMVGSIVFVAAVWRLFFKKGGGL